MLWLLHAHTWPTLRYNQYVVQFELEWVCTHKDKLHGIFNRQKGIYNQRMRVWLHWYDFVCNRHSMWFPSKSFGPFVIHWSAPFYIKLPICFFFYRHFLLEEKLNATIQSICYVHFIVRRVQEYVFWCTLASRGKTMFNHFERNKYQKMENDKSKITEISRGKLYSCWEQTFRSTFIKWLWLFDATKGNEFVPPNLNKCK